MKRIHILISKKPPEMDADGAIAWYGFDEDSYQKIIDALDKLQDEEAEERRKDFLLKP